MARSFDDVVSLSHLRWDFVFQRPQHLMSRFARHHRVLFFEEPVAADGPLRLEVSERAPGLYVAIPHLAGDGAADDVERQQQCLLDTLLDTYVVRDYVLWYYTPMAIGFTRHLRGARAVVYDCMDELSAFRAAPPELVLREAELFQRADLVFAGGQSLYEAKRRQRPAVHALPSSVELAHFRAARRALPDPPDQAAIPHPRLGVYGVLDERLDLELLAGVADVRPDWQTVLVGPTAKVDPADLPRRPNLHYLGPKPYTELPAYLAGWDVALLPFARNEATRFINPTKTPEYLAAGRPVVSTSIRDVVHPMPTKVWSTSPIRPKRRWLRPKLAWLGAPPSSWSVLTPSCGACPGTTRGHACAR